MMVGSVIGSQTGGQLASRTSYRNIMMVSGVFFVLGIYLLSTLTMDTSFTRNTIYDSRWAWCWFLILSIKHVFYSQVGNAGPWFGDINKLILPITRYDSWCNDFWYNSKSYFYR